MIRRLKTRVRRAKGRSASSRRWLERQLNDPYVAEARAKGYRSRAAFKLMEMDRKYRFLKRGARVLDLGAAPGGWTQVAVERTGGEVVAVDIAPMAEIPGAQILRLDFMDARAPGEIEAALGGKVDVVLSDMAGPATGHRATDHLKIVGLAEAALDFAETVLEPGGTFLCKVLRGGTEAELLKRLKDRFASVRHIKPPASRADSAEIYVLAAGFRPLAK